MLFVFLLFVNIIHYHWVQKEANFTFKQSQKMFYVHLKYCSAAVQIYTINRPENYLIYHIFSYILYVVVLYALENQKKITDNQKLFVPF